MKSNCNMKSKLTCAAMALMLASLARADYNPIPITPGSFNADVIVENTAPKPFNDYTTATMDGGTNNNAWVWYEQGYASNLPDTGIPAHGSTFSAADGSSRQFTMPPNYDVNNVLCVYSAIPSATLTLTEPTSASTLSVLIAGGG